MMWIFSSINIPLDELEEKITSLILQVCKSIPQLSNGKYSETTARICGGWVRDKILNKQSKDLDVSVDNMTGKQFGEFISLYDKQNNVGAVGRITTTDARPEQIKNLEVSFLNIYGQKVDLLSLRKEVYTPGNRNPIVTMATPQEDAYRRDLTLNALFYNINTKQVEDHTGKGLSDLKSMTLRTPLDPIKTFQDDPLRVLRVFRFYSRYANSTISPEVIEAIKDPGVQHQLTRKIINANDPEGIVVERTAEEFRKLMSGTQPEKALQVMYETGLLGKMLNLPASFNPLNMDQRNKWHQLTVIEHTLEVLKNVNNLSKEYGLTDEERAKMNFAALFHDLGKLDPRSHKNKPDGTRGYSGDPNNPSAIPHEQSSADFWKIFSKALQLNNEETQSIGELIAGHMRPHSHIEEDGPDISDKTLRRYVRKNPNWVFQYIHAMADAMSKSKTPDVSVTNPYRQNIDRIKLLSPTQNMAKSQDLLNGKEIMDLIGLPAAPPKGQIGYIEVIKERIREVQDENPNLSKEQAQEIAKNMLTSGELDIYKKAITWFKRIKNANNNNWY